VLLLGWELWLPERLPSLQERLLSLQELLLSLQELLPSSQERLPSSQELLLSLQELLPLRDLLFLPRWFSVQVPRFLRLVFLRLPLGSP